MHYTTHKTYNIQPYNTHHGTHNQHSNNTPTYNNTQRMLRITKRTAYTIQHTTHNTCDVSNNA